MRKCGSESTKFAWEVTIHNVPRIPCPCLCPFSRVSLNHFPIHIPPTACLLSQDLITESASEAYHPTQASSQLTAPWQTPKTSPLQVWGCCQPQELDRWKTNGPLQGHAFQWKCAVGFLSPLSHFCSSWPSDPGISLSSFNKPVTSQTVL